MSLLTKGLSRVLSSTTVQKHQFFSTQPSFSIHDFIQLSYPYMTTGKTRVFTIETFLCWQNYISSSSSSFFFFFTILSRIVIGFLPRSKCLLISRLQSLSPVSLEPRKIKSATVSIFTPCICHEVIGLDAMIFVFGMLSFKQLFNFPLSCSSKGYLVPLHLLPLG